MGGIFFNGVFTAILNLCLYWHIGDLSDIHFDSYKKEDIAKYF